MNVFGKKKELDLLTSEEIGASSSQKFLPIIILGVVNILFLGVYLVLFLLGLGSQNSLSTAKEQTQSKESQWQTYSNLANQVKSIQSKASDHQKFLAAYSGLNTKIDKIRSVLPQGVYLTNLTINSLGKTSLSGLAANPDEAYQFRDVLLKDKDFSTVSLDAVAKTGANYTFTITFLVSSK